MSDYMPVPRSQLAVRECPACGAAVTAWLGPGGSVVLHDDPPVRVRKKNRWQVHACPPLPPPVEAPPPPPSLF